MELLVGMGAHYEEFVDNVERLLSQKYPKGIESLLPEIPSNWAEVQEFFVPREEFFFELAKRYEKRGTKVIPGALPIDKSKPQTELDLLIDAYVTNGTSESMVKIIGKDNPQVVVVGGRHADFIKNRLPEVHYVYFDVVGGLFEKMLSRLLRKAKPDEVIKLVPQMPEEYYFEKYKIN